MNESNVHAEISGRCYCGKVVLSAKRPPLTIAYCHCTDCRRVSGAPVAAFAAFKESAVTFKPNEGCCVRANPGVTRTFCSACGSPLTGRYDYLPGMVYIAIGVLDQAGDLSPQLHAHEGQRLEWLHIDDTLERFSKSARSLLTDSAQCRFCPVAGGVSNEHE